MPNEKRLIYANALVKRLKELSKKHPAFAAVFAWVETLIHQAPTVDAVEVVRCKDCKHMAEYFESGKYVCKMWQCRVCGHADYVKADDFCSHGERRDENV